MTQKQITISCMNCHHCVMAVKKELGNLAGVIVKEVTIGKATIEYDETTVNPVSITTAIEEAGYTVVS